VSSSRFRVTAVAVGLMAAALVAPARAYADEDPLDDEVRRPVEALQRVDAARREADQAATADEAARSRQLARTSDDAARAAARSDEEIRDALAADASRRRRRNVGVWTSVGGGALVLLGGGLYASALSARGDVESGALATGSELESARARVEGHSSAAVVLGCIGGAAIAAGVLLVLTTSPPEDGVLARRRLGRVEVELARGAIAW
jgi:hypothetical protein